MFKDRLKSISALASTLPFHVEDMEAVNHTFVRWTATKNDEDLKTIQVWLYCYAQRYVLVRMLHESHTSASEVDDLIALVFNRAHDSLLTVTEPDRFTHWASVVCKNTFLNGRRSRVTYAPIDEGLMVSPDPTPEAEVDARYDRNVVFETIKRVVDELPDAIRPVARMRLLEDRSYDYIATQTQKPLPTVRAYLAKALRHLRKNPAIRHLMYTLEGPIPDDGPSGDGAVPPTRTPSLPKPT